MEKSEAIKMAHEIVKVLLETKQINLPAKDSSKNILDKLESLAKGIIKIEGKI